MDMDVQLTCLQTDFVYKRLVNSYCFNSFIASGNMSVFAPFRNSSGPPLVATPATQLLGNPHYHYWCHIDCQHIKMCVALSCLLRFPRVSNPLQFQRYEYVNHLFL